MAARFRWRARYTVLSVVFFSSILCFMDRMVISVLIPFISEDFKLTAFESGVVMSAFFAAYSLAQIPGGMLADKYGVRSVTTVAMVIWSLFTAVTGYVTSFAQMIIARFAFGLGEGVFPAAAFKTVAVWFPKEERATANAIKLASSPLGGALAPLVVVAIMQFGDWRTVFHILLFPGIIMAALFWYYVRNHPAESPRVSREELLEIEPESTDVGGSSAKIELSLALKDPMIVKYFLVLFAFDITYWGFISWLPSYLVQERGFSLGEMGLAASLPFFAGTVGAVAGGWVSDRYFSERRRAPLLVMQLAIALLLYLSFVTTSVPILVICQTLAGFALSFFIAAFWALPMNTVAKEHMGVISGAINMAGQVAAFLSPMAVGFLVGAADGGYGLTFAFLILCVIISFLLTLTLPSRLRPLGATTS